MAVLVKLFKNVLTLQSEGLLKLAQPSFINTQVRNYQERNRLFLEVPKPGEGKSYRRRVHYPKEYTVAPLNVTNLGGRDPVTGRKVCQRIGGGIKHKYHWIRWTRDGPEEGPPKEEKVLRILKCGCRTAHVALVATNDDLKYILATENMKPGDIIKTSRFLPRNPVRPEEGDAYPLGALPLGTFVHNVQMSPNSEYTSIHAAGCYGIVKRYLGHDVVVQLPSKREFVLDRKCMVTVGKLSNAIHSSIPIGSAQNLRLLGYRPRSGLWHRKKGIHGRKIRPPPPPRYYEEPKPKVEYISCTARAKVAKI